MALSLDDAVFAGVAFGFAAPEAAFQPHSWLLVLMWIGLPHFGQGRFGKVIFAAIDFSSGQNYRTQSYKGTIILTSPFLATSKDLIEPLPMIGQDLGEHNLERCEEHAMSADHEDLSFEKLVEMLQYPDPRARIHAGFVLGTLENEALPALPVLLEMLQSGDVQDRKLAAMTLGKIGPAACEAVPALLEVANEDEDVSDMAMWALEQIDVADTEPDAEAA